MKRNLILLAAATYITLFSACEKFLDAKSDQQLVVPSKPEDLQALLNNIEYRSNEYAGAPLLSSDDYYLTDNAYSSLREDMQRMYTWQADHIFPTGLYQNDWQACYKAVYVFNTVLDALSTIPRDGYNQAKWDNVKGQALALRAYRFFDALTVWSLPYDANTAVNDLGIPLRLISDFNIPSNRPTVQEGYEQVIADLKTAAALLPVNNINAGRPAKAMAYGLLARVYLSMRNYEQAMNYADSCLQLQNTLLDYNTLDPEAAYPFPFIDNTEVIFFAFGNWNDISTIHARIDNNHLNRYQSGDLRKELFFSEDQDGNWVFRGQYTGSQNPFCGLAVGEMWLTRAECRIRTGDIDGGMDDLNQLLASRWKTGSFVSFQAGDATTALQIVLQERQKELIMRGTRWLDLRRFNKEGADIILNRTVDGKQYSLPPNDRRYALTIPEEVIERTGMPQNAR